MDKELQLVKDRLDLKELVDKFSNYADTKDTDAQVALFTDEAVVNIVMNGKTVFTMNGKAEIAQTFSSSMADNNVVFHMNGQQTVEIDGDTATGIAYSFVVLEGPNDEGKVVRNKEGVRYQDEFIRVNGQWLINKRTSNFVWSETTPVK